MLFNLLFSMRYKNWCCWAKETAQRLSVLIALSEDPTLVSSPNAGLLKTTCNFSTGGTGTYFWPLQVSRRTAYNHKDIHIDTHIKNLKKKNLNSCCVQKRTGTLFLLSATFTSFKIPQKNAVSWGFAASTTNSATLYTKPRGGNRAGSKGNSSVGDCFTPGTVRLRIRCACQREEVHQ